VKLDRKAARERCKAATEGPWPNCRTIGVGDFNTHRLVGLGHRATPEDAQFIGGARTDLPLALNELDRKDVEIATQRFLLKECIGMLECVEWQYDGNCHFCDGFQGEGHSLGCDLARTMVEVRVIDGPG